MKNLTVLILAGGFGTRLRHLTEKAPKGLIQVNGRCLIDYAIGWADLFEPSKIIVISGYKHELLEQEVKRINPNALVIKNKDFSSLRMTGVMSAKEHVEGDLIVFDGDYIYTRNFADRLLSHNYHELTAHATRQKSDFTSQDVIVKLDDKNHLLNMVKTVGTQELKKDETYFNSLVYCPANHQAKFFKLAEEKIGLSDGKGIHVEDAIMDYVRKGNLVEVFNVPEPQWIEVDNLDELEMAEKFVLKHKKDIDY